MDYSLCRQTVTCYRMAENTPQRQVIDKCYLQYSTYADYDTAGRQLKRPFLLILPGKEPVQVGDLIYDGIGPEVTQAQWQGFVPANVPRLMQVQYVTDYPGHTEAGRKHNFQ